MTFGERLKKALEFRQLKQSELARAAGISQSQICLYIKDKVKPSMAVTMKIAKTLSIDVNYLLGVIDNLEKTYLEELLSKILLLKTDEIIQVIDYIDSMKGFERTGVRKEPIWRT